MKEVLLNFVSVPQRWDEEPPEGIVLSRAYDTVVAKLRNGEWADNLVINGCADLLKINIFIHNSHTLTILTIPPVTGLASHTVVVGHIDQMHYIAMLPNASMGNPTVPQHEVVTDRPTKTAVV